MIKSVRELLELTPEESTPERRGEVRAMTKQEKAVEIARLEKAMREAAKMLESRIATKETSGRSRPSRSRLMPTSTSKVPRRKSRIISMRSMVSMSWCIYRTFIPAFCRSRTIRGSSRAVPSAPRPTPCGRVLPVGGPDFHGIAPDPEHIALKGDVVALVADGNIL